MLNFEIYFLKRYFVSLVQVVAFQETNQQPGIYLLSKDEGKIFIFFHLGSFSLEGWCVGRTERVGGMGNIKDRKDYSNPYVVCFLTKGRHQWIDE